MFVAAVLAERAPINRQHQPDEHHAGYKSQRLEPANPPWPEPVGGRTGESSQRVAWESRDGEDECDSPAIGPKLAAERLAVPTEGVSDRGAYQPEGQGRRYHDSAVKPSRG